MIKPKPISETVCSWLQAHSLKELFRLKTKDFYLYWYLGGAPGSTPVVLYFTQISDSNEKNYRPAIGLDFLIENIVDLFGDLPRYRYNRGRGYFIQCVRNGKEYKHTAPTLGQVYASFLIQLRQEQLKKEALHG